MRFYSERNQDFPSKQLISSWTTPEAVGVGWEEVRRGQTEGSSNRWQRNKTFQLPLSCPNSYFWHQPLLSQLPAKWRNMRKMRRRVERPIRWVHISGGRKSLLIFLPKREGKKNKEERRKRERKREEQRERNWWEEGRRERERERDREIAFSFWEKKQKITDNSRQGASGLLKICSRELGPKRPGSWYPPPHSCLV